MFILVGLAGVYTDMLMVLFISVMKWNLISNKCYIERKKYLKLFWSGQNLNE